MKKWIAILLMLVLLSGCQAFEEPLRIEFKAVDFTFEALGSLHADIEIPSAPLVKGGDGASWHTLFRVDSVEELKLYEQSLRYVPIWQNRSSDQPYDAEYFQENVLFLIIRNTPSCSQVCWIERVEQVGETLTFYLVDGVPPAGDEGEGCALLGVEIAKKSIADCSAYEVNVQEQLICPT